MKSQVETGSPALENDPRWHTLQRVLSNPAFARSPKLCAFLSYICERAILNRLDELTEQQVGIHVFDRSPDYNASEDNIVRSQARLLRKKLDDYYAAEGQSEPIHILIPKGAYVPVFEPVHTPEPVLPVQEAEAPPAHRPTWLMPAVASVALIAAVWAVTLWRRTPDHVQMFWSQLFSSSRPTIIVPSDTAFVLYQNYTGKTVRLSDYIARNFWRQAEDTPKIDKSLVSALGGTPYTNNVDLSFTWGLARHPDLNLARASIRPARDLRMADLKGVNAVLLGARRANPWVELFDQNNNFQGLFTEELRDYILNRSPQGSEPQMFRYHSGPGYQRSYALIEFSHGLTGNENVLVLSGLNTAGTEGAMDFLLNPTSLRRFLDKITPPHGEVPHFELVLEVGDVFASAPRAEIVVYRVRKD